MNDAEKAMKVKTLQGILEKEFGITSTAELLEAIRTMTPVDISMFVLGELEALAVEETLKSGWLTGGPMVKRFAAAVVDRVCADHAVCFDSCTAALEMSLRILGIGPGDEVITTPYTYSATAEVIRNVGARLVFCDLKPGTFEMDYERMADLITPRTKAVIPVDLGGVPCSYGDLFQAISSKASLFYPSTPLQKSIGRVAVIADAAHSFGAEYECYGIGCVADFTCFSFHVLKSITTGGEGGAIVWRDFDYIDNDLLEKRLALFGDHGQTGKGISGEHGKEWEYDISVFGYNHIMTDVDASIGLAQLNRFNEIMAKRSKLTVQYYSRLPDCVEAGLQHFSPKYTSALHLFPIRIPGADERERNRVFGKMLDAGICCNVHYKPLPMFTAYIREGFDIQDYPVAYDTFKSLITLPYHTFMSEADVDTVCRELEKAVRK